MGQLAELAVEPFDLRADVVEATQHELASPAVYVVADLRLRQAYVRSQSDQILYRPVVEIEAESQQALLSRLDEPTLVGRVPLEQHLPLEHCTDPSGRLLEKDEHPSSVLGARPRDESRVRLLEPENRYAVNRSAVPTCVFVFAVEHE